jgi:hypothetical protein
MLFFLYIKTVTPGKNASVVFIIVLRVKRGPGKPFD